MTHEEMERAIDFVLQQQAKCTLDIQQLTALGSDLARAEIRTEKRLAALADRVAELTDAQKVTEARMAELGERLNIFINVVERHLSGNGKGQRPE